MLANHWLNSGVNGAMGEKGNEDQEETCCPTIWFNSGVNGEGGGEIER